MDRAVVERERRFHPGVLLAEQVMHCSTKCVDVYPRFGEAFVLLRRVIAFSADHCALVAALEDPGDSEVHEPHATMAIQHNVGRLDVTKDNRLRLVAVQVTQYLANLDGPVYHLCFGQEALCLVQDSLHVFAIHVLKDEVAAVILAEEVVDLDNAGMIESGKDVGLALEVVLDHSPHLGIGSGVQHLLGDAQPSDLGEAQVLSLVDSAHAANCTQAQNAVAVLKQITVGQLTLDIFG